MSPLDRCHTNPWLETALSTKLMLNSSQKLTSQRNENKLKSRLGSASLSPLSLCLTPNYIRNRAGCTPRFRFGFRFLFFFVLCSSRCRCSPFIFLGVMLGIDWKRCFGWGYIRTYTFAFCSAPTPKKINLFMDCTIELVSRCQTCLR